MLYTWKEYNIVYQLYFNYKKNVCISFFFSPGVNFQLVGSSYSLKWQFLFAHNLPIISSRDRPEAWTGKALYGLQGFDVNMFCWRWGSKSFELSMNFTGVLLPNLSTLMLVKWNYYLASKHDYSSELWIFWL